MSGSASEISRVWRGSRIAPYYYQMRCPCIDQHPRGKGCAGPSLLVKDFPNGVWLRCRFGCSGTEIRNHLYRQGLLDPPSGHKVAIVHSPDAEALAIWAECRAIQGNSQAEQYLRDCLKFRGRISPSLRWRRPGLRRLGQIVAGIQAPNGEIIAIQQLILDRERPRLADLPKNRFVVGALGAGALRLVEPDGRSVRIVTSLEEGLVAIDRGEAAWAAVLPSRAHRIFIPQPLPLAGGARQ